MNSGNNPFSVAVPTFSWRAGTGYPKSWRCVPTIARRLAYVLKTDRLASNGASLTEIDDAVVLQETFALTGVPIRNQVNRLCVDCGESDLLIGLRGTDAFGEVLVHLRPSEGRATAWSITINRILKGGVSGPSPHPEEQMIQRVGHFRFLPHTGGPFDIQVRAIEAEVTIEINGQVVCSFEDPDVAAGCFGVGTTGRVRLFSFDQEEHLTPEENARREGFLQRMNTFAAELDGEYASDVARRNRLVHTENRLEWFFPETGASMRIQAEAGALVGHLRSGLYGNVRLLFGHFATPTITDAKGNRYRPAPNKKPILSGDATQWQTTFPLESHSGQAATLELRARVTENTPWFWTAEVHNVAVAHAEIVFDLDPAFLPNCQAREERDRLLITDAVVGHYWQRISGQDTTFHVDASGQTPQLVLQSKRALFRWASMWLPMHPLILTGYKKRMLHFIRYPETPVQEWRERPSVHEYPSDEELLRYAHHGVRAMVWHHTWTSNNFRQRDGFVVNETEMRRAMKTAHELGIDVIGYIGIVPGRHPVLRYEDLSVRAPYDKNWDLQDFTFYSVAGRFAEFLPYMTDHWCREYGLDGFYFDGGPALLDWGFTGLSEKDVGDLSLEELNDRLFSRIQRVLRRHQARFGLENWGGSPIHLVAPFYHCRMIGESFQEAPPEKYRDGYNALLTGTPFKMYGMDLKARNRYNIAMAAVCLSDIQICSGNYAWGCWPDRPSDWANLKPFWRVLDSIDWDHLQSARPWWAQDLVEGEECYASYYATPRRVVLFLANRTEQAGRVPIQICREALPEGLRTGVWRPIYPEPGETVPLGNGRFEVELPRLHDGPVGFEIVNR